MSVCMKKVNENAEAIREATIKNPLKMSDLKGNIYKLFGTGINEETGEKVIIYQDVAIDEIKIKKYNDFLSNFFIFKCNG